MEYVEGADLETYIKNSFSNEANVTINKNSLGAIPLHVQLSLAEQLARALGFLHNKCIIHRDVKTSNILVTTGCFTASSSLPTLKIIDFGCAHAKHGNQEKKGLYGNVGTLAYSAPEVLRGATYNYKVLHLCCSALYMYHLKEQERRAFENTHAVDRLLAYQLYLLGRYI